MPDPNENGKGWIDVIVKRFDKNSGETVDARFTVHEPAAAGEHRVGFDSNGTSELPRRIQGKLVPVNFDCGYDLESVKVVGQNARVVTLVSRTNPKDKIVLK
jgi:hypothetical protein